jgi:hypothetical protein
LPSQLHQIPPVAVQILEDGDDSVRGLRRLPYEAYSGLTHGVVVPPEVISTEKQEYPAARLIADEPGLLRRGRPGQQQGRALR